MTENKTKQGIDKIAAQLSKQLGEGRVSTTEADCVFYAQDVYSKGLPAGIVVSPQDIDELALAVKILVEAGVATIPRGGGMSYTSGYVPVEKNSAVLNMGHMNKVLEVNANDMYVTVECGCTWQSLDTELEKHGLRTPFWGTLSGLHATVGGSLSQNSIFWGTGRYGSAADSVLSLRVILADGSVLHTGAAAQRNGSPFFRYYGPDLSGLFLSDTGALGIKAHATLKLIDRMPARRFASFAFETAQQMLPAMSDASRRGLAMECFAFDPALQNQRMKRESIANDIKTLGKVARAQKSPLAAAVESAKIAFAGRRYMKDVRYSAHFMLEGRNASALKADHQTLRRICQSHGGQEIENSIPKIARANPFAPLNNMLGPRGERWAPVHCLAPHSRAIEISDAIEALFARHADEMQKLDVITGHLYSYIASNAIVIEPVFFWPDEINELHRATVTKEAQRNFTNFGENLPARELVAKIREELVQLFCEAGVIHMQIGKAYHYQQGLREESMRMIKQIKSAIDPLGRINPGSLGLTA